MEEGRRANQIHIDAANAEAARLAAERAARPEEALPRAEIGVGVEEASPAAISTEETNASPPDHNVSTDKSPPSGVAGPEPAPAENPATPPPESDVGGAIAPPEPVHIGRSTRKL